MGTEIGALPYRSPNKQPTFEELAIIVAATDVLWPRPTVEEDVAKAAGEAWKFANRWWQGNHVGRRGRPTRPSSFS
jgi:hypothetical protein